MSKFYVLIPSAGIGARMQAVQPKQYIHLLGKPIIRHAVDCFESMVEIANVFVLTATDHAMWQQDLLTGCTKSSFIHCGGHTRAATVLNGLNHLLNLANADDWVLVHDAARPGIQAATVRRLLSIALTNKTGGLLGLPVADTLKRSHPQDIVAETIPREGLWLAQTPQMFRLGMLQQALTRFVDQHPTDEAQAIEWFGHQPQMVLGDLCNLKITYPQDLATVSALIAAQQGS